MGRLEGRDGIVVQEAMLEPQLTARPCPVCGSQTHELLYRQRFAAFAAGSIGDGYDVVACSDCGTCFASGLPPSARFAQYYADSSKYDLGAEGGKLSQRDAQRYADQATFVATHLQDRDMPILDVGTATGGFLLAFREAGFAQLFGVDPSPDAVRVARDTFHLDVAVGGLSAAETWGRGFGLISYVAVLEHLLTPREQVRAVTRLLRPGGCIFVSVPDAGAFRDHAEAPFQEFSVEHINYFTERSLANAMAAEGYSLVAQRTVVLPFGTDGNVPTLEAIYHLDSPSAATNSHRVGPAGVRDYIQNSTAAKAAVIERIAQLASSGERIYVWGTGTHTLHLLETSRLGDCRIEAFIDSNPHYAGATLARRPVIAPATLEAADAPILVSSAVTQTRIADAARAWFGPGRAADPALLRCSMGEAETYAGRKVFVTGHTGFKGAWLAEWLSAMGAQVTGYALDPPTEPNLFNALELGNRVRPRRRRRPGSRPARGRGQKRQARRSSSILPLRPSCGVRTRSLPRPSTPTSWVPSTCSRLLAPAHPFAPSSSSPATSATRTLRPIRPSVRPTPWAGATRTAPARAAPSS